MEAGRILVGEHDGVYLLKFVGDVRVTLCATMDGFLHELLERDDFRSVLVDLTETDGIDSTALGLLAKLSLETQRRFGVVPTLVSTRPDITRVLRAMGFPERFLIFLVHRLMQIMHAYTKCSVGARAHMANYSLASVL